MQAYKKYLKSQPAVIICYSKLFDLIKLFFLDVKEIASLQKLITLQRFL